MFLGELVDSFIFLNYGIKSGSVSRFEPLALPVVFYQSGWPCTPPRSRANADGRDAGDESARIEGWK